MRDWKENSKVAGLALGAVCWMSGALLGQLGQNSKYVPNGVPIGGWTTFQSHRQLTDITFRGEVIYASTTAGFVRFDPRTEAYAEFSHVSGLRGNSPSVIRYHHASDLVFLGYTDGTIDYFQTEDNILTINEIRVTRNHLLKRVNEIIPHGNLILIATDFGIVVYDLVRREARATYTSIDPANREAPVKSLTIYRDTLWAGTTGGLFCARLNHPNLADGAAWSRVATLPAQETSGLAHNGQRFFAIVGRLLYLNSDSGWAHVPDSLFGNDPNSDFHYLRAAGDRLSVAFGNLQFAIHEETPRQIGFTYYFPLASGYSPTGPWVPHGNPERGLVVNNGGTDLEPMKSRIPVNNLAVDLDIHNGELWVGTSRFARTASFAPTYNTTGAYVCDLDTKEWKHIRPGTGGIPAELHSLGLVRPGREESQWWVGTWDHGLLEFRNTELTNRFRGENSTLQGAVQGPALDSLIRVGGVVHDAEGYLWVSTFRPSNTSEALSVRSPSGQWRNFNLLETGTTNMLEDANGYKWITLDGSGVLVYDDRGTPENPADDRQRLLTAGVGNGNLVATAALCVQHDRDGAVWVGTTAGVSVFYNTAGVFNPGGGSDASCPIFEFRCLLNDKAVNCIAVDGANRKWVGTQDAGVYVFSADGTEQVAHFTMDNSLLISNLIYDIAFDSRNGAAFFATEAGIVSYMADAPGPFENHDDLVVFPSPVRTDYNGPITIRGTSENALVRVLTPGGQLVREVEATGGQANWNGQDVQGNRLAPGVYVVQVSSPDGQITGTSKFAVVPHQ